MPKCKNCHCKCHCKDGLHPHHFDGDLCTCNVCEHKEEKNVEVSKDKRKE